MLSNRLAFAALATACIAAAAGGGYLASRQNAVPAPAAAQAVPGPSVVPTPAPVSAAAERPVQPVQETEALVGDTAKTPGPRSAAPKRAETAVRPSAARQSRTAAARPEPPPTLTNTWPSSAAAQPPAAVQPPPTQADGAAPAPRPEERVERAPEPSRAPEPPQKTFEELVVSASSVIGIQIDSRISSDTARVEDRVDARVTRDVKVDDRVAIPAGSRAIGSVMIVERGGKFKERARLGIRFNSLVLADGTRLPITTETIYRDGEAPGNTSAAKVGGAAVGGAILGAILGGATGAAIGGTVGAGAGTAAVVAGDKNAATLAPGTPMTVRILSPITVTIER